MYKDITGIGLFHRLIFLNVINPTNLNDLSDVKIRFREKNKMHFILKIIMNMVLFN